MNLRPFSQQNVSQTFFKPYPMLELFKELWQFLKIRKKFWMLPIIVVLFFMGALIVFGSGSAFAPFIYTLF